VPSARLLWIGGVIVFPAMAAEGLLPSARVAAAALVSAIFSAAVIDALLEPRALAGVRVELPALLRLVQGCSAPIPVTLHHQQRKARQLRVGFNVPDGVELDPEERWVSLPPLSPASQIGWECWPRRRGTFRLHDCFLEAPSPLGLWTVRRRQEVALELRVYPNLRDRGTMQALRRGMENLHVTRQIGRGREFEKLREYSPGDSSEEIHWKTTARRGRPITKVYRVERTQEIYLVLDVSRLSARADGGDAALEWAIKAALTLGAITERSGDLVGVAAFAQRVEAFVRARRGKRHYAAYRDALNELHPQAVSPDFDEIAIFLLARLQRRCLIIFLTALDDPVIGDHFRRATRLLAQRHLVMAAAPRPSSAKPLFQHQEVESSEDIYRALAGHLAWRKLRALQGALSRQGVTLVLLEPQMFAAGLAQLYDDAKQRQLI
jgi:uncharacterized protein (DUF58 family)